jgi:filamentous hemagglutinin family protein
MVSHAIAAGLPTGGNYVAGSGAISSSGSSMQVMQSTSRGIINWDSFSIGAGNRVAFNNGSGATLNRVTGSDLSQIMGNLSATGSIYLINKNGIVIGASGVVTTGGSFVASTRDIDNALFMNGGNPNFLGTGDGAVVNAGSIVSTTGDVVLVGRSVSNTGSVTATKGSAQFLAADQVLLKPATGASGTYISGGKGDVTNAGTVKAAEAKLASAGGNVYALAINNGNVTATGTTERNGRIWLTAGGSTVIDGGVTATNADGTGGKITATGQDVRVKSTAKVSASGKSGGGTILIGGTGTKVTSDEQVPTAQTVTIENGAQLNADATETGAGGNIVVWSDGLTKAYGSFSAKGVTAGGFIETSGHEVDFANITVDTRAINGTFGEWLVDPTTLTIDAAAAATINTNLSSSNVTLTAGAGGVSGAGAQTTTDNYDIVINGAIGWSAATTLTLTSDTMIHINNAINVNGNGGVTLNYSAADATNLSFGTSGAINFNGAGAYASQALTINGTSYKLIYTMAQLDAIDATSGVDGSALTVYGSGLAGNYALATNLDASGTTYTRGIVSTSSAFSGSFEGLGHSIASLTIAATSENYLGLFGYNTGTIRDLGIDSGSTVSYTGSGTNIYVGGLVGLANGSSFLVNDYSAASIAYNQTGTTGAMVYIGGLIGVNNGTAANSIYNSYATGDVTVRYGTGGSGGVTAYLGGLAGYNGNVNVSAILGAHATGTVSDYLSSGQQLVGGLVGYNDGGISSSGTETSYATGSVSYEGGMANDIFIGGLVGQNGGSGVITRSYSQSNVTYTQTSSAGGTVYIGGLVGLNNGSAAYSIFNVFASGSVVAQYGTGGSGNVDVFAGGLLGINTNTTNYSVDQAYATGAVIDTTAGGAHFTGGLFGYHEGGTVSMGYSTGYVSGTGNVGGALGYNGGTVATIYWNTQSSGTLTGVASGASTGVSGLTSAQMKLASSFSGWDFTSTWAMVSGTSYPYLQSQGTPSFITASGTIGAGKTVAVAINGTVVKTVATGADGSAYIMLASGALSNGGSILLYSTDAPSNAVYQSGGTSANGLILNAGELWVGSGYGDLSTGLLGTAKGSLASSGILYSVSGGNITSTAARNILDSELGNITVSGAISVIGSGSLTLSAHKDMAINAAIALQGGNLTLQSNNADVGAGAVSIASNITTNGGAITIGGGTNISTGWAQGDTGYLFGLSISNATINAGGGNILLRGQGVASSAGDSFGVAISNATIETSGTGQISISGVGGYNPRYQSIGVKITNNSLIQSQGGDISIVSTGQYSATGNAPGFELEGSTLQTDSGNINITGTAGENASWVYGVYISGLWSDTSVSSSIITHNGNVVITGYGANAGTSDAGVEIDGGTNITVTGSGNIQIWGESKNPLGGYGIVITDDGFLGGMDAVLTVNSGNMELQGKAVGSGVSLGLLGGMWLNVSGSGGIVLTGLQNGGNSSIVADNSWTNALNRIGGSGDLGHISFVADSMSLSNIDAIQTSGAVAFNPYTSGVTMGIGSGVGALSIGDALLSKVSAGSFVFGSTTTGLLTVNTAHDFGASDVTFVSGGSINLAGTLTKASGTGSANYIFQAAGSIYNSNSGGIVSSTGSLNLTLDSNTDNIGSEAISLTGATLSTGGGSLTINDNLVIAGAVTLNDGGSNNSFAGVLSGTGSLVKDGAGILTLSGVNTYSGATTVNDGTLKIAAGGQLGSGNYTATVTVASGANLTYSGTSAQSFSDLRGAGTINLNGSGTVTISGDQAFAGTLNVSEYLYLTNGSNSAISGLGNASAINVTNGTIDLSNEISANSLIGIWGSPTTITLNAGGTLTQSGSNTFHLQNIVLNGGTLASGVATGDGASYGTYNLDRGLSVTADSTISAPGMALSEGGGTYITVASGATLTLSGGFDHSGNVADSGLILNGGGTILLSGVNGYTSNTTISNGTLRIGGSGSLGGGSYAGDIAIASGSIFKYSSSANQTLSGAISGAGSLVKDTDATSVLTLSGANSFTGSLTASAGTVTLSGSWNVGSQTASVTLGSGATLNGSGVITADTLAIGGAGSLNLTGHNLVGTFEEYTGGGTQSALTLHNQQDLTLGSLSAIGNILITVSGNLAIDNGASIASAASGNAIVLDATGAFVNHAGGGAIGLTGGGRWLIYSANPSGDTFGSLDSGHTAIWDATYVSLDPASVTAMGNRYIFANQPTLTVTTTDVSITYGDSVSVSNAYTVTGYSAGVTGAFAADSFSTALTGSPSLSSAGTAAGTTIGAYGISVTAGTLSATSGYAIGYANNGVLNVTARPITVTADNQTKVFNSANPNLTYRITSGSLYGSDNLTGALTTGATVGSSVGTYAITQGSLAANSNYSLTFVDGVLTVSGRSLVIVVNNASKGYAMADPVLTYTVSGLIGGDTIADALTGALSRVAGEAANTVYAITQGTLRAIGSYAVSIFESGTLTIGPSPAISTKLLIPNIAMPVVASDIVISEPSKEDPYRRLNLEETHIYEGANLVLRDSIYVQGPSSSGY